MIREREKLVGEKEKKIETHRIHQHAIGSGKIGSPISDIPADAVVADLFEENSGWWNGVLIDKYFLPLEAQKIKSIPICITPQEDILIWPKTRDGKYSVKTGYQLLREMENRELALASDTVENKKFWTGLWKLKVPNKIKTFAWCELAPILSLLWII